jgi:hypothetical protein
MTPVYIVVGIFALIFGAIALVNAIMKIATEEMERDQ